VVAVNPGSLASHTKWSEANNFGFPIVVDTDKKVAAAYGALKPEGGIQRTVVLVDKAGRVAWVKEGMPATEEIIAAIEALHKDDPDNTRLSSS
jgi:peroxiredoxin